MELIALGPVSMRELAAALQVHERRRAARL
jgi:hypothetical protein